MTIQILQNRFEIVLPNATNEGMPLFHETQLQAIAKSFGGFTVIDQQGGWEDGGKLYNDNSQRLVINFQELSMDNKITIEKLLKYLYNNCGQLAVFFQINDTAMIIDNGTTLFATLEAYNNLKGGL